ncbi:hypothetical protein PILCRDRAFT_813343 [Piloderma croceum F 1598]|uniref:Transmembrane protein n=1 Tax=Piloderma croceum (strain F 1598) TaxID=765440 RepID=A0A0C3FYU5_PILCF|nr:hypothetical protein PILCRDRAFT_813343 [Piloderma croceum F 1598]
MVMFYSRFFTALLFFNRQQNFTVDDSSLKIVYFGTWERGAEVISPLAYGSRPFSTDPTAAATLSFTGSAIYYMSPLWPYSANVLITLDNAEPVWVNLTHPSELNTSIYGPEPAKSEVVWGASGLSDSAHKVIMSMPENGSFIALDTFIYTSFDFMSFLRAKTLAVPSTIPLGSSAEASASPRKLFKRSKASGGTSALIVILCIVAIAAVVILLWRCNNPQHQGTTYPAYPEFPVGFNQNVQLPPSPPSTFQYPPSTRSPGAVNQNVQLPPSPSSALQYLPSSHSPNSLSQSVSLFRSPPWPTPPAESVSVRETRTDTPWYSYEERTISTPTTFYGRSVLSTPEASHVDTLAFRSPRSSLYSSPVRL